MRVAWHTWHIGIALIACLALMIGAAAVAGCGGETTKGIGARSTGGAAGMWGTGGVPGVDAAIAVDAAIVDAASEPADGSPACSPVASAWPCGPANPCMNLNGPPGGYGGTNTIGAEEAAFCTPPDPAKHYSFSVEILGAATNGELRVDVFTGEQACSGTKLGTLAVSSTTSQVCFGVDGSQLSARLAIVPEPGVLASYLVSSKCGAEVPFEPGSMCK